MIRAFLEQKTHTHACIVQSQVYKQANLNIQYATIALLCIHYLRGATDVAIIIPILINCRMIIIIILFHG